MTAYKLGSKTRTGVFGPILVWLVFSITTPLSHAGDLQLVASGKAYHFKRDISRNENNWGLGVQYLFDNNRLYQTFVTANSFKDSYDNTSNYVGGGFQRRVHLNRISVNSHLDFGVLAFAMTRKNYRDGAPFLGALPFASFGNQKLAVNLAYVPHTSFNESSLVFVQFMFNLNND